MRSSWKVTGPSQSIPSQRSDAWICSTDSATSRLGVGVLDPQAALAAELAGEQPVEEEGAHAADVEEAGRARSHANADAHRAPIVRTGCSSARTCPPRAASTRRSTGSRRSGATACRCSRRARGCGSRRRTSRSRSSASRHGGPKRASAASSATRSTSATSPRPTRRSTRSRSRRCARRSTRRSRSRPTPSSSTSARTSAPASAAGRKRVVSAIERVLERCDGDTWL